MFVGATGGLADESASPFYLFSGVILSLLFSIATIDLLGVGRDIVFFAAFVVCDWFAAVPPFEFAADLADFFFSFLFATFEESELVTFFALMRFRLF
jgi:hypothetical protein